MKVNVDLELYAIGRPVWSNVLQQLLNAGVVYRLRIINYQ